MNDRKSSPAIPLVGRTAWLVRQFRKQLWFRALLFSLGAIVTALLASVAERYIPYDLTLKLVAGSVDDILNILATSMLAVTTFSLSIMVSAYSAATANVTPRSTKLLLDDPVAQNTLATFLGSFLFSIVGIIGLAAGLYGDKGRIVLFLATLVVIAFITGALLVWIEHLGRFGRVGDTIRRVEKATLQPAEFWGRLPRLGARPAAVVPDRAMPVQIGGNGYVEHVDAQELAHIADEQDLVIHLDVLPGALLHPLKTVAYVDPPTGEDVMNRIAGCFTFGTDREFDQDPQFGLIVLSEIASRALSPAVNDPGTAIEVIDAGVRVLIAYSHAQKERDEPSFDRLHAPDLKVSGLFDDFFNPIARDGAGMVEVHIRLQAALQALVQYDPALFGASARQHATVAARRADEALLDEHDRKRLRTHAGWLASEETPARRRPGADA